jgi:hyaluronoglucosaminidase
LTVVVGHNADIERALHVPDSTGLAPGGYVLVAGRFGASQVIVLDGVDAAGDYYAAQTLRQLLSGRRSVPALVLRDWPSFRLRGVVEGFYGPPWSAASRLGMLDFMGRHKLNFYMYLPKDDPFVRRAWRAPMSRAALGQVGALEHRAGRDHITLSVGVSPGDTICYTSAADLTALVARLDSLWRVGVRSFTIALDDIDRRRTGCDSDVARFGTGNEALAAAQAQLLNRIDLEFVRTRPGAGKLIVVPTEYSGVSASPYQLTLARLLRSDVQVQWTGPSGISAAISTADLSAARTNFGHPIIIWDNYFVNDYLPGYLVLGPYAGRARMLSKDALGITANPMGQAEATKIGLFTVADFTWNEKEYEPTQSWDASLTEFAGGDARSVEAIRTFAGANLTPAIGSGQASTLSAAMESFWRNGAAAPDATARLRQLLVRLRDAPAVLQARLANRPFLAETQLWLTATQLWAGAAVDALDAFVAHRSGLVALQAADEQKARALREQAQLMVVPGTTPPATLRIGGNVLADFVHFALRGYGP